MALAEQPLSHRLEEELQAFFAAAEPRVPGWVFALVAGDETALLAGGQADPIRGRAMDPIATAFPVASVSKPVTAALLAGLAADGTLDLQRDVDSYLDRIEVPDTYPGPVVLADLLTHTSGLDDRWTGMAVRSPRRLPSLAEHLSRRLPPRVFPPGEVVRYSNDGFALAGAVAEAATGLEFAVLAERRLLAPLGMRDSSFGLRPELERRLATGHRARDGELHPVERDFLVASPAAGLVTTATDMAAFLRLHLDGGRVGGRFVLPADAVEDLQRHRFSHHPALPGVGYGILEGPDPSRSSLYHAGGFRGHSSLIFLLPDERLGFFLAYNRGGTALAGEWMERFVKVLLPAVEAPAATVAEREEVQPELLRLRAFQGTYRTVRVDRSTLAKLASLVVYGPLRVEGRGEGRLRIRGLGRGWVELQPMAGELFRRLDGEGLVAFERRPDGKVQRLYLGAEAYERLSWYQTGEAHVTAAGLFVLVFLTALRVRPLRPRLGVRKGDQRRLPEGLLWARRLAGATALLNLTFLAGIVLFFAAEGHWRLLYGVPWTVRTLLGLPLLAAALLPAQVAACLALWVRSGVDLGDKLRLSLFALGSLLYLPYLHHWNLLGFRF